MTNLPDDLSAEARDRVEEEAAQWLVRLSEAPDDAGLRAQLDLWRSASPLHEEIWVRTNRAYGLVGMAADARRRAQTGRDAGVRPGEDEPRLQKPAPPTRERPTRKSLARLSGIAAAVVLIVGIVAFRLPDTVVRMQADYATATAERRIVALDDGSRVHLAPLSAIDVSLTGGSRRIRLIEGQAYFDVVPESSRPFEVRAGEVVVTVLGTAFEVDYGKKGTTVAVTSGRVRVEDTTTPTPTNEELVSGDWIEVSATGARRGDASLDQIGDWVRGELIAYDRPIGEIVDDLRPYYDGAIIVWNHAFAEKRVSGLYDLADPEKTLRDLAASHNAVLWQVSPWLTIITAE